MLTAMRVLLLVALMGARSSYVVDAGASVYLNDAWQAFEETDAIPLYAPVTDWEDATATIYVSISSFRDYRCPHTLKNLFTKAQHPERLHVGLIVQMRQETKDKDCFKEYCTLMGSQGPSCKYRDQIHSMEMSAIDSKGPSFSRYLHSLMLSDEDFYLQIDSHMDFAPHWDTSLTLEWGATGNEFAVLTSYPSDTARLAASKNDASALREVPYLCEARFTPANLPRYLPAVAVVNLQKPTLQPLWSSMFSFSRAHAMRRVPPDPNLLQAYDGVDFSIAARLWTRGYDFYAPSHAIVFHDYHSSMNPAGKKVNDKAEGKDHVEWVSWTENGNSPWHKRKMFADSSLRLKTLLHSPGGEETASAVASLTKFGLGSARTLQQYIAFSGVNPEKTLAEGRCSGRLQWVAPATGASVADMWGDALEVRAAGGSNIPLLGGGTPRLDMSGLWHHMRAAAKEARAAEGLASPPEPEPEPEPDMVVSRIAPASSGNILLLPAEVLADSLHETLGSEKAVKVALLLAPVLVIVLLIVVLVLQNAEAGDRRGSGGYELPRTSRHHKGRTTSPLLKTAARSSEKIK